MRIDSIRQWQWIVFSVVIGFTIGYLREQAADDLAAQYGTEINGQARFEQALVTLEQGRPCFTDIKVVSRDVPDRNGVTTRASLVAGLYFNGHYEPHDGKLLATWEPAFFIASIPYKPATDLLNRGDGKAATRFASVSRPLVTDFLDALAPAGVHYTRAWWQGLRMWQWVILCFVTIGVIWPIALNLMVFGSWRRPREEKGIDLSKVKPPPQEAKQSAMSEDEIAELAAMSDDLEQQLASEDTASEPPQPAPVSPVRELSKSAVSVDPEPQHDDVAYGTKPDDYYPTAKVAPRERKK